jgi:hypothetical protein
MPQSHEEIKREWYKFAMPNDTARGVMSEDVHQFIPQVTNGQIADWWLAQRDADKGGEKCEHLQFTGLKVDDASGHLYTNFTIGKTYKVCEQWIYSDTNEKILMSNNSKRKYFVKSHSPKPQANVGDKEIARLFALFGDCKRGAISIEVGVYNAKDIISTTSAQKLESLERSVEGLRMSSKACICYPNYDDALSAVLDIIRKQK